MQKGLARRQQRPGHRGCWLDWAREGFPNGAGGGVAASAGAGPSEAPPCRPHPQPHPARPWRAGDARTHPASHREVCSGSGPGEMRTRLSYLTGSFRAETRLPRARWGDPWKGEPCRGVVMAVDDVRRTVKRGVQGGTEETWPNHHPEH